MRQKIPKPRPSTGLVFGTIDEFPEGAIKYHTLAIDYFWRFRRYSCLYRRSQSGQQHLRTKSSPFWKSDFYTTGDRPKYNINDGVGSTHPEGLQAFN